MISYDQLKRGVKIIFQNQPCEIIESAALFKGRGHSVLQARLKNLITGNVIPITFQPSNSFQEAEINDIHAKFLYAHRDKYVFAENDNPSKRFELTKEQLGNNTDFLKANIEVKALEFEGQIINIELPIKVILKVVETPPGVKGERAQSGTKPATMETGGLVAVPLFVSEGDMIEVNTENGEYVRRVE